MAYGAVDRRVWNDERFREWDRDTRDVWLYLLTCPHGNRLGCFVLPAMYVAEDVQMSPEAVKKALQTLQEDGRIVWDPKVRMICIRNHLAPEYNPLANPNVVTAALDDLAQLPDSLPCIAALKDAVERYGTKEHYRPLLQEVTRRMEAMKNNGSSNGSGKGSGNGMPNPEPDPDPELDLEPEPEVSGADAPSSDRGSDSEVGPERWMHDVWHDVLGIDGHPITLNDDRKQKYRSMYEEQLSDAPDPETAWRAVLWAVTKSEHHMSNRGFQMPESILKNKSRRETWVQKTIDALRNGGTKADRKSQKRRDEVLDYLQRRVES